MQLNHDLSGELVCTHSPMVAAAIEKLSSSTGTQSRGAIFTRAEVVDFILDLAGYTEDQPLHEKRLLEPSFGGGDFLLPAIGRLLTAWRSRQHPGPAITIISREARGTTRIAHRPAIDRATRVTLAEALRARNLPKADGPVFANFRLTALDEI